MGRLPGTVRPVRSQGLTSRREGAGRDDRGQDRGSGENGCAPPPGKGGVPGLTGRDILAVAEHREGRVVGATYELVAKGRDLAAEIAALGSEILVAEHEALATYTPGGYAQALAAIVSRSEPRVVLFSHTAQGFDLAPRLAAEWNAPVVANCVDLWLENGRLVASRKILNDKLAMELEVTSERPFLVTLRPGSVKPAAPASTAGAVVTVSVTVDPANNGSVFVGYEKPQVQDIDISAADIVVSAGRGIQKRENLAMVEELARVLGGVVGASRPLTDMEWLPKTP